MINRPFSWRITVLSFLSAVLVSACGNVQPLPSVDAFAELPTVADKYWRNVVGERTPGVVGAFFQQGESPDVIAVGSAAAGADMSEQTVFQVASISKPVAAYGVLTLVASDRVDLSAPAERYLRRYSFPRSRWGSDGVTIERVLSHTAGLSLTGYPGFPPDGQLPTIEESLAGDTGRFFGFYSPPPVRIRREPGAEWRYSGGGYTVLQLIVEEVTGMGFSEYMAMSVLEPLEMRSSTFDPTSVDRELLAVGHTRRGRRVPDYLFTARAAAGLYSTAEDLARLLKDLHTGAGSASSLLDRESYRAITAPRIEVSPNVRMGLGFHLEQLPDGSTMAYHYGGNRGWQSYFGVNLSTGDGMVILTNSDNGIDLLIDPVLNVYREFLTGDLS